MTINRLSKKVIWTAAVLSVLIAIVIISAIISVNAEPAAVFSNYADEDNAIDEIVESVTGAETIDEIIREAEEPTDGVNETDMPADGKCFDLSFFPVFLHEYICTAERYADDPEFNLVEYYKTAKKLYFETERGADYYYVMPRSDRSMALAPCEYLMGDGKYYTAAEISEMDIKTICYLIRLKYVNTEIDE